MSGRQFKITTRKLYSKIGEIKCPAFPKEKIVFNAKGFGHLFYQGSGKTRTRTRKEIAFRVKLLDRAVKLIKLMPLPQEESVYTFKNKNYRFWAFEGVIEKRRIKVIIRQIGNGKKHFWSVIPAWKSTRFGPRNAKTNLSKQ